MTLLTPRYKETLKNGESPKAAGYGGNGIVASAKMHITEAHEPTGDERVVPKKKGRPRKPEIKQIPTNMVMLSESVADIQPAPQPVVVQTVA